MAKSPTGLNADWEDIGTEHPKHPSNIRLHEYYLRQKPAEGLPNRADFDLLDLPDIAPGMFIAERDPDREGDIRFRLVGSAIEERLGVSLTGRGFSAFSAATNARLKPIYEQVFVDHKSFVLRGSFVGSGLEHLEYEAFLLPMMSRSGDGVNVIGGMFAFD
jgi:hypothetical protein